MGILASILLILIPLCPYRTEAKSDRKQTYLEKKMKLMKKLVVASAIALGGVAAHAGPVVIDGTDANDHGGASAGVNQTGWLYMQRVLESLASNVTASAAKVVVDVGTSAGQARDAINSAFALSVLPGLGWSLQHVDGAAAINSYFSTLSTANTGILYIPTAGNSSGDLTSVELAAVNANATSINLFVAGAGTPATGGGLFAMGETGAGAYGWLTTLIPGIVFTDVGAGGTAGDITLTAAGAAAFPSLTNAELAGADPWHGYFSGSLGGLSVLGIANDDAGVSRNLILGGGAGTVIGCGLPGQPACPPTGVPEPDSLPLMLVALGGLVWASMRKAKKTKAA